MAEYTFLLGSGVSLASGVQGVKDITDAIFGEEYWQHTDQSIIRGEPPAEYLKHHYAVSKLQGYLKLLKEQNDDYLKERIGVEAKTNFEDLYDLAQQIYQETGISRDNLAVKAFVEKIEAQTENLRNNYNGLGYATDLRSFSYKAMGFIETVIKYGLNEDEVKGLDIILQLLNRGSEFQIFTLNHDLLIERLCDENGFNYTDGFSELDGEIRWYKPEVWDIGAQVKVYKLHGSRNWNFVQHPKKGVKYAILTGREKWHNKDAEGNEAQLQLDRGYILTGQRKSENYYTGIHGEIHYRFAKHLKNCKNLIVSGYGWNDIQLNWKLFDWLDSQESSKMIIIHRNPEQMANDSRYLNWRTFDRYSRKGKIEWVKKWFQDVMTEDIVAYTSYA